MNIARLRDIAIETDSLFLVNEPLGKHLTLGIGGVCPFFIQPKSWSSVEKMLTVLAEEKVEFRILGFGSNIIADDNVLQFGVLHLRKLGGKAVFNSDEVAVDADFPLPLLVQQAVDRGLGGIEGMGGIPGSVGGALVSNAGAFGNNFLSLVRQIEVLEPERGRIVHPISDFEFGYRSSNVSSFGIAAGCRLKLQPVDFGELASAYESALEMRARTQPLGRATAGSIFKNPPGDYAGRILDELGFKGKRRGRASFSELHANFLVNHGGATFDDAFGLCEEARLAADDRGYLLEYEVERWP